MFEIKATVENRCLKVINRLRENKCGLKTKNEGNTSIIRENNETTDAPNGTKNK